MSFKTFVANAVALAVAPVHAIRNALGVKTLNVPQCPDIECSASMSARQPLGAAMSVDSAMQPDSEFRLTREHNQKLLFDIASLCHLAERHQRESHPRQGRQQSGELPSGRDLEISIPQHPMVDSRLRSVVSIFRVPSFLKVLGKSEAYVPKIVSFGPYHHGRAELEPMEIQKVRALYRMMTRFNSQHGNEATNMTFYNEAIGKISEEIHEIRKTYELEIDSKQDEDLTKMLILDGCFIIEILRSLGGEDENIPVDGVSDYYERIFEKKRIDNTGFDILNDILKLENQIPLIVLRRLLELEFNSKNVQDELKVLVIFPWAKFYPFQSEPRCCQLSEEKDHHFLGVLHSQIASELIVFTKEEKDSPSKGFIRLPCAVELWKAGIKCNKGSKIEFERRNNTVYIPPINITDHTEVLFRNLMALELCRPSTESNCVICYVSLMDELINSAEDVALLRKNKIITNYLGSDIEVAELFNGLCNGVTLSAEAAGRLMTLKQSVYERYNNQKKVQFTEFVNEKFSSPWKALALVGAVFVLVLTLLQTIFTILPYFTKK